MGNTPFFLSPSFFKSTKKLRYSRRRFFHKTSDTNSTTKQALKRPSRASVFNLPPTRKRTKSTYTTCFSRSPVEHRIPLQRGQLAWPRGHGGQQERHLRLAAILGESEGFGGLRGHLLVGGALVPAAHELHISHAGRGGGDRQAVLSQASGYDGKNAFFFGPVFRMVFGKTISWRNI